MAGRLMVAWKNGMPAVKYTILKYFLSQFTVGHNVHVTTRFVPLLWKAMASKGVSGPNDDIDWPYETMWSPKCFEKRF